jgi:hypothetical protein
MRDACHAPDFLVWAAGQASEPLPPMPHATPERIASYVNPPEQRAAVDRIVEKGGRGKPDQKEFAIYHLLLKRNTAPTSGARLHSAPACCCTF